MKIYYGKAISELEQGKTFEETNIDSQKGENITAKRESLDDAIQATKDQIELLDNRIKYFQSVVDNTEKALNDIFNIVGEFTALDAGNYSGEGHAKRSLEIKVQQLIERLDMYKADIADAGTYRASVESRLGHMQNTRDEYSKTLGYIAFIKHALEEEKVEPKPEVKKVTISNKEKAAKITKEIEAYAIDPEAELSEEAQLTLDTDENLQQQVTDIQKEVESVHDAAKANPGLVTADAEKEKLNELKAKAAKATEASLDDSLPVPDYSHLQGAPSDVNP
jgi:chromosome segregation ATPase